MACFRIVFATFTKKTLQRIVLTGKRNTLMYYYLKRNILQWINKKKYVSIYSAAASGIQLVYLSTLIDDLKTLLNFSSPKRHQKNRDIEENSCLKHFSLLVSTVLNVEYR